MIQFEEIGGKQGSDEERSVCKFQIQSSAFKEPPPKEGQPRVLDLPLLSSAPGQHSCKLAQLPGLFCPQEDGASSFIWLLQPPWVRGDGLTRLVPSCPHGSWLSILPLLSLGRNRSFQSGISLPHECRHSRGPCCP